MGRALRELDVHLLSHLPGNAQAKGKIERFFRFFPERLLAFKVQLHIHPGERTRVWQGGSLVAELPHEDRGRLRDAPLTVEQVLEDILAATQHHCPSAGPACLRRIQARRCHGASRRAIVLS